MTRQTRSPRATLQQHLDFHSIRDPETGCLLWTDRRNANGYGCLSRSGQHWLAHRAAWAARHGPIPPGLLVCHRCDVRNCINPDHLFLGTQKQNMADKAVKWGHERRTEEGPERRPTKSPEIMRIRFSGKEYVTRVLSIRPLQPPRQSPRQPS